MHIDLNCDLGESFGIYNVGMDEEIIKHVSSVNIACGWHAGDPNVMARTVAMAVEHGVAIGCHPGFKDLEGFGRRNMQISAHDLKHHVMYQIGALDAFVKAAGGTMTHVKPHGAMYNMAAKDLELARAIVSAVYEIDPHLILLGLAGSELIHAAKEKGLPYAQEGFADRRYRRDGTLVPRSVKGAKIESVQEALDQVVDMVKNQRIQSIDGHRIALKVDSICVHGDNIQALAFVKAIHKSLENNKICIKGLG